ncbi:MAG: ribonuclease domain-containing protein [Peptococcaceae bacterium]|nr:ribonuclease domain-containing protein [Peptococcaceae bacterium]
MKRSKKLLALLLSVVLTLGMFTACAPSEQTSGSSVQQTIDEDGSYTSKDEVALYIHTYGHLPENYITKDEAYDLGWKSEGTLDEVAPGKSIGGDYYGNYEGHLPDKPGREYHECDIDYVSGERNAKRLVYANDGNIYYTEDHYNTFEHLYGDDE